MDSTVSSAGQPQSSDSGGIGAQRRAVRGAVWLTEDMASAKEEVARLLAGLPADTSYEDIQYHIYVREKIERGRRAIDDGDVLSEEEAESRLSRWLTE